SLAVAVLQRDRTRRGGRRVCRRHRVARAAGTRGPAARGCRRGARSRNSRLAGAPARPARPLPLRRGELPGDRRHARRLAGQGQDRHSPGPRGPEADPGQAMTFEDLERRVHRELERLPSPLAPDSLLPRVLAAVDAWARRPWYTRAWFTWPLGWQVASVLVLALFAVGIWMLPPAPPSVVVTTNAGLVVWR